MGRVVVNPSRELASQPSLDGNYIGNLGIVERPLLAFVSSVRVPPDLVLSALDLARDVGRAGGSVVGGFQTPLERRCLEIMLRHTGSIVICLSRKLPGFRVPGGWSRGLEQGRVLLLSTREERRPTASAGVARNRLVVDLASEVMVVHAVGGSRTYRVAADALDRGKTVYCFEHARNADLELLGAKAVSGAGAIDLIAGSHR
jgi:predicted Rossmann fold nucleotide-binding protein DprA/Smf involved in DNA uptake